MTPETLDLARLQFALTAGAHFLFVALTLGLATLVASVQTRATIIGDPVRGRMTRFWGQLYIINYGVGIVTGLVMELQLGLNWGGLAKVAGPVFGAPLALETLLAFFVESTFLGLWIFGWHRLNRWAHLALIWIVTLTAWVSAYWIIVANGFLQNPVGFERRDGELRITDAGALFTNPDALVPLLHIAGAALLTAGFFMAGISAYHLRQGTAEEELFRRSLRIGIGVAAPAALWTMVLGFGQLAWNADNSPMKAAVGRGDEAEQAKLQAEMAARFGPGDYTPPAWIETAATVMLLIGFLLFVFALVNLTLMFRRGPGKATRFWRRLLTWSIPLPFVAMISGWLFREVGRQPWAITELLRTEDAVSAVSAGAVRASLVAFALLFAALVTVNWWLLARFARRGPEHVQLGAPDDAAPEPAPVPTF